MHQYSKFVPTSHVEITSMCTVLMSPSFHALAGSAAVVAGPSSSSEAPAVPSSLPSSPPPPSSIDCGSSSTSSSIAVFASCTPSFSLRMMSTNVFGRTYARWITRTSEESFSGSLPESAFCFFWSANFFLSLMFSLSAPPLVPRLILFLLEGAGDNGLYGTDSLTEVARSAGRAPVRGFLCSISFQSRLPSTSGASDVDVPSSSDDSDALGVTSFHKRSRIVPLAMASFRVCLARNSTERPFPVLLALFFFPGDA